MDQSNLGVAAICRHDHRHELGRITVLHHSSSLLHYCVLAQPAIVGCTSESATEASLPTICLLWGVAMMCFGFVTKWESSFRAFWRLGIFQVLRYPHGVFLRC